MKWLERLDGLVWLKTSRLSGLNLFIQLIWLNWVKSSRVMLNWVEFGWLGLHWAELSWIWLNCVEMVELDWIVVEFGVNLCDLGVNWSEAMGFWGRYEAIWILIDLFQNPVLFCEFPGPFNRTEMVLYSNYGSQFLAEKNDLKIGYLVADILFSLTKAEP